MNNRPSIDFVVATGVLFIGCVVATKCKLWYPKANNHNTNNHNELKPSWQVSSGVVSWNISSTNGNSDDEIVQLVDRFWIEESKNDLEQTPEDSVILFGSEFSDGESCTSRGSSVVYHDSVTNESLSSGQGESSYSSAGVPSRLHIDQSASPRQDLACECCKSSLIKFSQSDEELIGHPMIRHSLSVSSSTSPSLLNKHYSPRMSGGSPMWRPYIIEKMRLPKDNTASSRRNRGCSVKLRQKYHARLRERRIRESKDNHWVPYSPPRILQTSISGGLRETNQQAPGSPLPQFPSRSVSVGAERRSRRGRRTVNAAGWTRYSQMQGPDAQFEISQSHSCGIDPQ